MGWVLFWQIWLTEILTAFLALFIIVASRKP